MGGDFGNTLAWIGAFGLIGALLVLSWPYRRERFFRFERVIPASRERIWDIYDHRLDLDEARRFHKHLVSVRRLPDDPQVEEVVLDPSGLGASRTVIQARLLTVRRPELCESHYCRIDSKDEPFGPSQRETLELEEHAGGTLVRLSWQGEAATLWQTFALRHNLKTYVNRLQAFCENGAAEPERGLRRKLWSSLGLTLAAVASFALLFGWQGAILITLILVVHEFGHWLAMRMTGQPAPRMVLIPFFGGMAVANHPHKSLFDDAFCALMGAGFSTLPCLALLLGGLALGLPEGGLNLAWLQGAEEASLATLLAEAALLLAFAVGLLNAFQLMPLLPLDGGHILRALIQSLSAQWARPLLLGITGLGMLGFSYYGWAFESLAFLLLAATCALGALQAWYLDGKSAPAAPMRAGGLATICLGYGLTLTIHLGTSIYVYWLLLRSNGGF